MHAIRDFAKRHPFWSLAVTIAVIDFPQWFQSVWSLFRTDAPIPWIWEQLGKGHINIPMPEFSAFWITVPLGVFMFVWLVVQLRRGQRPATRTSAGPISDEVRKALGLDEIRSFDLSGAKPRKPRYAAPKNATPIVDFEDLGDRILKVVNRIYKLLEEDQNYSTDVELANQFMARFAREVLWLYGEAKSRGVPDTYLDAFYENPGELKNIGYFVEKLEQFGHRVKIYTV